jgi:hypothetical protein
VCEWQVCCVCMDAPSTHAFVPCGHRCVCHGCATATVAAGGASCPVCHCAVQGTLRIYG